MEKNQIGVVIADNDFSTRVYIREILEKFEYTVLQEAEDGIDAVEACKKHHPNLIILSLNLKLLDGLATARIISNELLADAIVVVTTDINKSISEKIKNIGANSYIVKPIEERILIPCVEMAIASSSEIKCLKNEIKKINERLENRVLIEKAKGIIMDEYKISEQEAYEFIKRQSLKETVPIRSVAQMVVSKHCE